MGNIIAPAPTLGQSRSNRSFRSHALITNSNTGRQDAAFLLLPRTSFPSNVTFRGDDVEHGFIVPALETSKRQTTQAMKIMCAASMRAQVPTTESVCSSAETSESLFSGASGIPTSTACAAAAETSATQKCAALPLSEASVVLPKGRG